MYLFIIMFDKRNKFLFRLLTFLVTFVYTEKFNLNLKFNYTSFKNSFSF